MADTYKVVKAWNDMSKPKRTIMTGLTLDEARRVCSDPKTSHTCQKDPSKSWMYVFYKE